MNHLWKWFLKVVLGTRSKDPWTFSVSSVQTGFQGAAQSSITDWLRKRQVVLDSAIKSTFIKSYPTTLYFISVEIKKKIEKLWKKPRFFDWRTIRQARHSTRILGSVQLTSVWCSLVPEIDNSRFTFIRRFRKSLFQNSRISEIRIFRHFVELSVLRIEIQLSHKLKQLSQNR